MDDVTEPLIVTSAINPPEDVPFLQLLDPQVRLFQTYCGLIRWIRETKIQRIILCDNSEVGHLFSELVIFAEKHHKLLEVLMFKGDHRKIRALGKGYGEGEIMKYVMEHSRFLQRCTGFYKITGRLFVEGFDALHDVHAGKSVVFDLPEQKHRTLLEAARRCAFAPSWLLRHVKGYVDTRFYKCTKRYYVNHLIDCFQKVDDRRDHWLEHTFTAPLLRNRFELFSARPCLVGVSGTSGIRYGAGDYADEVKRLAALLLKGKCR